ncbi:MAG: hypothetical protein V4631_16475 [Pseudomonadota bacterium]
MNNQLLTYKGYQGSAEVSLEDDCLFGRLLFLSDLVTYEAQTVTALRQPFEAAVDYYLEQCAALRA